MMDDRIFIDKKTEDDPLHLYEKLRQEAIDLIQSFSGKRWTDYNLHDPGITIMEQFCYAITELIYKADFEIKDLLTNNDTGKIEYGDLGLVFPHVIFPSKAVTLNDFRKVIFDAIPEAYNVWVYPEIDQEIQGLYTIVIGIDNQDQLTEEQRKEIICTVKDTFNEHRNLTEDILEVHILETKDVEVHAVVEVSNEELPETIVAQILYRLSKYILNELRYCSIDDLLEDGLTIEEIFTGPLLKKGFISEEQLKPHSNQITIENIFGEIGKVAGVVGIREVYMKMGDKVEKSEISFPSSLVGARLSLGHSEDLSIQLVRGGRGQKINTKQATNQFFRLRTKARRINTENINYEEYFDFPKGEVKNTKEYFSIQNQFPSTYGIGKMGPDTSNLSEEKKNHRKAIANQLKAYLLIFEQLMGNFFAQLDSVNELFSVHTSDSKSYYSQVLNNISGISELFCVDDVVEGNKIKSENKPKARTIKSTTELENSIASTLKKYDDFYERKNRVLDYLLALYGEGYSQKSLTQFNYYFLPEEINSKVIENKVRFLKEIPQLNANKSKGEVYHFSSSYLKNISGLERRVRVLLNLCLSDNRFCIDYYKKKSVELLSNKQDTDTQVLLGHVFSNQERVEREFEFINFVLEGGVELARDKEQMRENNRKFLVDASIPEYFFRTGVDYQSYKVGRQSNSNKYTLVHYTFCNEKGDEKKWRKMGNFVSKEQAIGTARQLRNTLVQMNQACEGILVVEHILLRPRIKIGAFQLAVLDQEDDRFFRINFDDAIHDKGSAVGLIQEGLKKRENYQKVSLDSGRYSIQVVIDQIGKLRSEMEFATGDEALEAIDKLIEHYKQNGITQTSEAENSLNRNDFYSFGISILLPKWTARFHDTDFRKMVSDTIRYCAPAHCDVTIYWLPYQEMVNFESLYLPWLDLLKAKKIPEERITLQSQKIVDFLIQNKELYSPKY